MRETSQTRASSSIPGATDDRRPDSHAWVAREARWTQETSAPRAAPPPLTRPEIPSRADNRLSRQHRPYIDRAPLRRSGEVPRLVRWSFRASAFFQSVPNGPLY